jgi:hypothetical protein
MATVNLLLGQGDTTAAWNSNSFTPTAGSTLVVFIGGAGTIENPASLTSSVGGQTFELFTAIPHSSAAAPNSVLYGYVGTAAASASSQTVTYVEGADPPTGVNYHVYEITGITKLGLSAIRQSATDTGAGLSTPAAAFSVSALTGNPTLGAVHVNNINPATMTPPTNWTEGADTGHATPDMGMESCYRNSGFTGTTMTWGNAASGSYGIILVEIDASASSGVAPRAQYHYRKRRVS